MNEIIRIIARNTPTEWERRMMNGKMCNVLTQELLQKRVDLILQKAEEVMEVMLTRCVICKHVISCYDSRREEKKCYCDTCTLKCPNPTKPDSHGYCAKHFIDQLEKIRREKNEAVQKKT